MCGFAGFYGPDELDRESVINDMSERIAHRGPDSSGTFLEDQVALGFRRLSIIDLAGGTQPLHSADDRYVIVFNGEIYNYKDLRKELTEKFYVSFATDSDTETIIEVYRRYGENTASKLRGMFAFVIYDREKKTLYGARDYFGIKPFYYTMQGNNFVFGSEIKSFLDYPGFEKEINPDALKMYLVFQYSPLKETIFKGVYKLPQGTYFTYKNGELKTVRYFETTFDPKKRSFDDAVNRIDEIVESFVEYHKIADVEVGGFLSGGVDSSYITSVAKPQKTYSVGFNLKGFDETSLAGNLSDILGISNKIREITPDEFFDALPKVQYFSDEPHANLSAVPLFFLSELAAKDVKVVLSGEGADEFFGGYDWYIESEASRKYRKMPKGFRNAMSKTLGKIPQSHIKRFFKANNEEVEDTYIGQAFIMSDKEANYYLTPAYKRD
ncbi:MAG: asparagine synthase (glutamine-hydrolyzing), partial [Lachnospiraceae bacterium]|nr:asparagine synthase (glutamine-hydrolyzing) [Lachnospiraceae bacterium]